MEPSPCEAYFKVYTQQDLAPESEKYSLIGGTVYPVLYVRLGAASRVAAATTTLTVSVQDMHAVHINQATGERDPATIAELDTIDLAAGSGWERLSAGTWVDSGGPAAYDNQYGEEKVLFRHRIGPPGWDTKSAPMGHNDEHLLFADEQIQFASYDGAEWGANLGYGPRPKPATIGNLVVSEVSSNGPDGLFLLFDADHTDSTYSEPTIRFDIIDAGDPHVYMARIYVRRTSSPPGSGDFVVLRNASGSVMQFGTGKIEYKWDGMVGGQIAAAGPYHFDVQVLEFEQAVPQDGGIVGHIDDNIFKCPYFTTYSTHDARTSDDQSSSWIEADYELADQQGRPPTSVSIWAVAPDLTVHQTGPEEPWPTSLEELHEDQIVHRFVEGDPAGDYWTVFSGFDNRAPSRRDHLQRPILAVNVDGLSRKRATSYDQINDAADDESHAKFRGTMRSRAAGVRGPGFVLGFRASDTATPSPGSLPGDHVMFHRSHGNGAIAAPYTDPPSGGAVLCGGSWLYACRNGRSDAGAYVSDFNLGKCRIVIWKGCHTSDSHPSWGNMAWQTGFQGAEAAVGYHGEVTGDVVINKRYFQYIAGALVQGRVPFGGGTPDGNPMTISAALSYAVQRLVDDAANGRGPALGTFSDHGVPLYFSNSDKGGLDKYHIKGVDQGTASAVTLR